MYHKWFVLQDAHMSFNLQYSSLQIFLFSIYKTEKQELTVFTVVKDLELLFCSFMDFLQK